jgi:FtsP/CotA-like multicopper oxidase with cupredoxin domain
MRSGTYMYHSHANESHQLSGGLYGALLVVDSADYHPEVERLVVIGGDGERFQRATVNGSETPRPLDIPAGVPIRLRLVSIAADWRIRVSLVGPSGTVPWTMIAKDAADIPPNRQIAAVAAWRAGPGETADYVVTLTDAGAYQLIIRGDVDDWQVTVPVRGTRAGGGAD